jgi:Zn-dependent protease
MRHLLNPLVYLLKRMWHPWRVGSAFGIGIYVHSTLLLLPLYVILSNWVNGGWALVPFLLLLVTAVFGCVLLHELGHALTARHFGIGTRDIILTPIGGIAWLERLPDDPIQELLIALAGPAVNIVIAGVLIVLLPLLLSLGFLSGVSLFPQGADDLLGPGLIGGLLGTLLLSNLMLAGFNLIPAFPMDGGRVLRALLSLGLGRMRATEVAAAVAVFPAIGIGIAGVFLNPVLVLLAVAVFLFGRLELAGLRAREARRRAQALQAEEGVLDVLPVTDEAGQAGLVWDRRAHAWVPWHDGRAVDDGFRAGPE